jgi:hypothetical protein
LKIFIFGLIKIKKKSIIILRDLEDDFKFTLSNNFGNAEKYLKEIKKIYYTLKHKIIYVQEEIKDAINYIFNIEEDEKLKDYTSAQRYAVYLIKQKGKLHTFIRNNYIIRDSFSNKYEQFQNTSEENLLNELKNKSIFISMIDTHKSNDLSSIYYAILEELVKTNNNPIKKFQNCGMYFISNSRLDEIYCDYVSFNTLLHIYHITVYNYHISNVLYNYPLHYYTLYNLSHYLKIVHSFCSFLP